MKSYDKDYGESFKGCESMLKGQYIQTAEKIRRDVL